MIVVLGTTAACGTSPVSGQVMARVDGEEITRRELAAELSASGSQPPLSPNADRSALETIVIRKVMALEARKQGMDQTPEYILASRRSDELTLGSDLLARWRQEVAPVSPRQVTAYISRHPRRFYDHALVWVTRVTAAVRVPANLITSLRTVQQVKHALSDHSIPFEESRTVVDTDRLSGPYADRLRAALSEAPLIEQSGNGTIISIVTQVQAVPLSATTQHVLAVQDINSLALQERIRQLRAKTTVQYQAGINTR